MDGIDYCEECEREHREEVKELMEQLKAKEQECEELKEKYEALKLENEEGYEIVDELKQECEGLKSDLHLYKTWYRAKHNDNKNLLGSYRKALEEIEKIVKKATELPCVFSCDCNNCAEKPTKHWDTCVQGAIYKTADIINKAKAEEDKQ